MGTNRAAARATVAALAGRLKPEHEALTQTVLSLSEVIDLDVGNERLWREYRAAVASLLEAADVEDTNDADEGFASAVRTPMGHAAHAK